MDCRRSISAVALAVAMALPVALHAQPGHGMPPPGQMKHGYDRGNDHRGDDHRGGPQGRPDWHFDNGQRDQFARRYRKDIGRWQRSRNRPHFTPGYVIPRTYTIQPVPASYWAGQPPPPPGYRYGYTNGYVVAYDPTTRIVADVLDLVAGFSGR